MVSNKKFKNVLVVLGGTSGERKVSLVSCKACIKALKKKNYKVSSFDPKHKNFNLINKHKIDVIFNALHGKGGEDGVAQSYFEYLKMPYTHSGLISSYNAMNKLISKKIVIIEDSPNIIYDMNTIQSLSKYSLPPTQKDNRKLKMITFIIKR